MTDQLPHSDEVEAALVARLLVDPAQLPVLAGKLEAADFYSPTWRKVYAGMQLLSGERRTVDIVALKAIVGPAADELSDQVGSLTAAFRAPVEEYAELVRGFAFRRRLIGSLDSVITKAYLVDDREALLAQLHDAVQAVSAGIDDGRLLTPSQAVEAWAQRFDDRRSGRRPGLSWGLPTLDRALLPASGGEMIVVAARPSVGKTALAETIADAWARQSRYPILFASLEMSVASLLDRQVSRDSGVDAASIVRGHLEERANAAVLTAGESRRNVGIWYLDDPHATTSTLRAAAAKVRILAGGVGAIVLDYLQLLKDAGDQETSRVTRISRQVKAIAREFDVPLLALSQLSRAPMGRQDEHPRLSDLRESGAIEQDADTVLGLYRPVGGTSLTDVDILKARQGAAGQRVTLYFDHQHVRFTEYEEIEQEEVNRALEATDDLMESEVLPY